MRKRRKRSETPAFTGMDVKKVGFARQSFIGGFVQVTVPFLGDPKKRIQSLIISGFALERIPF